MSIGESVIFDVEKDNNLLHPLKWRHNGSESKPELDGKTQYTIFSVALDDAGIYECHQNHAREYGKRTAVREAFSYGIRHVIRHVHCDSMSYDQIRVKPYPVSYRV